MRDGASLKDSLSKLPPGDTIRLLSVTEAGVFFIRTDRLHIVMESHVKGLWT